MISKTITVGDIASVTGYSRHKLKGLFRELPGFCDPAEQARVAREYSRHDLVVLAVCCELDERYGLKRSVIGGLLTGLQNALSGPRTVANNAFLFVNAPVFEVEYLEKPKPFAEGLIVPLYEIFRRVDSHLEYGKSGPLNLGPVAIPAMPGAAKAHKVTSSVQSVAKKKMKASRAKR
jgi:hypothetical protein